MNTTTISDTANATLALKGILGIGALRKSNTASNGSGPVEHTKSGSGAGGGGPLSPSPSPVSKKHSNQQPNSSKKKKKQAKDKQDEKKQSVNKEKGSKKKKDQKQAQQQQQQQQQQGNTKGTKKKASKAKGTQSNKSQTKDENFAWSAFQSPPDPSTLPLPAFGNSFSFEDSDKVVEQPHDENDADPIGASNSSKDIRSKGQCKTPSKQNMEKEIKAILNISNDSTRNNYTEEKAVEKNDSNNSTPKATTTKSSNDDAAQIEPSNPHGINLASLTISTDPAMMHYPTSPPSKQNNSMSIANANLMNHALTPHNTPSDNKNDSTDPIAMLMNAQSYGTANPTIHSLHQPYSMYHNQHHASMHYPMHSPQQHQHHHHQQIMPPYYTIQVQVPPVLMPGRRMIVPASPMTGGYPIPVVVPEGVVPGMLIPVSIPNPNTRGNTVLNHH